MSSFDHRIVIGGIVILALGVFIAAAPLSREAYRATPRVAAATEAAIVPTELMIASRTNEQADQATMWSTGADPESFDRAGLDIWWKNYEKKRPAR
jgi:hypothetical protein